MRVSLQRDEKERDEKCPHIDTTHDYFNETQRRYIFLQKIGHQLGSLFSFGPMYTVFRLTKELKSLRNRVVAFTVGIVWFTANFQDGCDIATSITIIGCTPDSDETIIEMILATLHDELMRPGHEL